MLRIVHLSGHRAPGREEFSYAPVVVGTASQADVCFDAKTTPAVAPYHAEVGVYRGHLYVQDLHAPGGTYVRGQRVATQCFAPGEPVAIGGPQGPTFTAYVEGEVGPRPDRIQYDADNRIDLATAQQLVRAAVEKAVSQQDKTNAIIDARVRSAKRRGRLLLGLLSLGVLLSLSAAIVAFVYVGASNEAASILADEAGLGEDEVEVDGEIPDDVLDGRAIYDENKRALYVMAYLKGDRIGGCCSAFAIGSRLLATNAHCVLACEALGGNLVVVQNDSDGKQRYRVVGTSIHDDYRSNTQRSNTPDVGLLRVSEKLSHKVKKANAAELYAIGPGDDVFVLGFPGRLMDPIKPSATFLRGNIGRTTDFDDRSVLPAEAVLLQHDAVTRGGNSGSPIFNQYGHVIGIHTAHIDDEEIVTIDGEEVRIVQSSPFRLGMRIDLLNEVSPP